MPTRRGHELVFQQRQVSGDQGKQVAGLGERIMPGDRSTTVGQGLVRQQIAVGQHHRIAIAVGHQGGGEPGQHVGPILIIGDPPEAFRLTLGAVHAAGAVQAFQRRVLFRVDSRDHGDFRCRGQLEQGEGSLVALELVAAEPRAVDRDGDQLEIVPFQPQRRFRISGGRAFDSQPGGDLGHAIRQIEIQ